MLELWFDFSCPYAYLASRRAHTLGCEIAWRPMLLGGVFRGIGAGDGPLTTLSPAKAKHNLADMHRWATQFAVPFAMPGAHPMRTVRALRTLLALPEPQWPNVIGEIFAAYWQRGDDITDSAVIADCLARGGVAPDAGQRALTAADSEPIKAELRQRTDDAIARGIFGAPAWIAGDGTLVWGQDRFGWLEQIVEGWNPDAGPPPRSHPFAPVGRAAPDVTLDVYFDVASPFAYLALTQLGGFVAMGATPRLHPILLGALFRDIGQVDVPLAAMPAAKARYVSREMLRWARWWGVPFDMPRKFPQRTVTAQRLILLCDSFAASHRLATRLARAMWAEQRDLEDDDTLRELLVAVELPPAWVDHTRDPAIKQRLIDNTAHAKANDVFGVPTFIVSRPGRPTELLWGQDRLELVASYLR